MPNSAEALKADREKARVIKANQRARARAQVVPPPLPARAPVTHAPMPVPVDNGGADVVSLQAANGLEDAALVPWLAADLAGPLMDTLELLEEADQLSIEGKMQKANLPKELQREIADDAAWPKRSKDGISKYGANALAKGLNALGLSAKHKDVALIAPSLAYLIADRVKLHKRLDALIKAANPTQEKKP